MDGTQLIKVADPIIQGLDENFLANNLDRAKLQPLIDDVEQTNQ
jgi:hypothetical protein